MVFLYFRGLMALQPKSAKPAVIDSSARAEEEPKKPTAPVIDYFDD